MSVETRPGGPGTVVITVHGEVDIASAPVLRDALTRALGTTHHQIVVDLDDVTFMDAARSTSWSRPVIAPRSWAWASG